MNLADLLHTQAEIQPDAPALIDRTGGRAAFYTFARLDEAVARAATMLRQSGLRPGDRALLFHPMSADLYIALGALFRLGAAAVFVDPGLGRAQIADACARWQPQAFFGAPRAHLLRLVVPALRRIPLAIATGWGAPGAVRWAQLWRCPPDTGETSPAGPDTPALITTTSGSTGRPKVALRTQGFLLAQHKSIQAALGLGPGDRVATTLPIFVLSFLAAGAATLLPGVDLRRPGRVRAGPLVAQIVQDEATCLAASPAFLEQIARHCAAAGRTLPHITRIFGGGAPLFPDLLDELQAIAPNASITAVYGATEAEPIAHIEAAAITPADRQRMAQGGGLLVGLPVPSIQVRILPDRWETPLPPMTPAALEAAALPPGDAGEILVSGSHVLPGYEQGEGDAETILLAGDTRWRRTGDAGYLDEKGRLWLLGRCAARVEDARGLLYPFAVECAAHTFAEVKHAALVSLSGERVLALELYRPLTEARQAALCKALAWAHLDRLLALPRLPVDKRHNAKIDYPALRRLLAQRRLTAD
ncbi:MAG TPA: AMP-binding protein [Caldilineaceae bacterium]|nr:AMP-binding protein [Caldilineaceae bacterium]